jgi:hypothetical protein
MVMSFLLSAAFTGADVTDGANSSGAPSQAAPYAALSGHVSVVVKQD